jgi:hypothetical protein
VGQWGRHASVHADPSACADVGARKYAKPAINATRRTAFLASLFCKIIGISLLLSERRTSPLPGICIQVGDILRQRRHCQTRLAATFASPHRARHDSIFPLRGIADSYPRILPTATWNPRCHDAGAKNPGGDSSCSPGTTSPLLGSGFPPALRRGDSKPASPARERYLLITENYPQTASDIGQYFSSYCSFAYSALACFRMGMSGSASFQRVRKSL